MKRPSLWLSMLTGLTVLAAIASTPATAAISDEEELARFGGPGSGPGSGQLQFPDGIAADPITGHVYTAEQAVNHRISEFTPWGDFVKAFGWDVAPGAVNEQQEVRVRASTGQFRLTFGASTTGDLAFDAPSSESEGPGSVEAALNALPSIGGSGGEVSVQAVPGTPDGQTPFIHLVAFKGSLAATNVAQLTVAGGTTPPSGGVPSTGLEVRTRADGHAVTVGLEACTVESGCKAGLEGGGAGQLARPRGVTVDADGNVYVREVNNRRVQKFDSAGHFVWMAGGEVNKTTSANLCTAASGDECGVGVIGAGPGQFGEGVSGGIANCAGTLFVADKDKIQRLDLQGTFEAPLPVPGRTVNMVACDLAGGDLYASLISESNIRKLEPGTGNEIGEIEVEGPGGIVTDTFGNLFVAGRLVIKDGSEEKELQVVREFDPDGKPLTSPYCCNAPPFTPSGLGINSAGTLYVSYGSVADSFIRSFGPAPVTFEAAPKVPPTITAQFVGSVGRDDATVGAEINPHFWSDTSYYVEYGTGKCSEGGCTETKPVPAAILSSKTVDAPLKSAGIFLEDLEPGTTYHYRFVAESTGGGPVRGIGGEVGLDGEESTFTTFPVPAPSKTDCPNQAFRAGTSAPLPDCRAYEMVSPLDKNSGDIRALFDLPAFSTAFSQSATDGDRFTYTSYRGFADPKAAPYTNQYLATREDGVGWTSESLDLAQVSRFNPDAFENHSKAFTADLCQGWLMTLAEPAPVLEASEGFRNIYRRDNCSGGGLEGLIGVEPTSKAIYPVLQGTSADGKETIFLANDKLTEDAEAGGVWQAYYASEGQLHLLCVLPNGLPSGGSCSAGTLSSGPSLDQLERFSSLTNAISDDGSRVYLTDAAGKQPGPGGEPPGGPGKLYLRLNPGEDQSEVVGDECTEPEKACTVEVSDTATTKAARFLRASADGSKAVFEVTEGTQQGSLFLFDLAAEDSTLIAGKGLGLAGASEDLSRIYFASEDVLPETSGASSGKANLYLDQEGTKTFIATLSSADIGEENRASNIDTRPIYHAARVTPDGRVLAFISTESLTGYDNIDLVTGKADSEVYLYEVGSTATVCVSCNPSGARPLGRGKTTGNSSSATPTAAFLPMADNQLYTPRVLSNDGRQLFFHSFDALLPRDTNGKADVYQWQKALDQKACDQAGAELYVPSSGGCLSLISTGQSPQDSELLDISANGQDAFFTTNASLLPQDPGLVDVYDARANGGLPIPPEPPGPCQGEACQSATVPPNDPTPASASFRGAGNPSVKPRPRCAKGKARRKGRCVAKRKGQRKAAKGKRARYDRKASR